MKVAFVVQRYGEEICGGAELHCWQLVERMAKRWDVEVLTTCAVDYLTWENHYPPGLTYLNDVPVRRFAVDHPRDARRFGELCEHVFFQSHSREEELAWMRAQGPYSTSFNEYIRARGGDYDFVFFFTYLYCTTFYGMPAVMEKAGLVPTAHDEPPIYLDIFREVFQAPKVLAFNSPQERDFVNQRFGTETTLQDILGVGVQDPPKVDPDSFRCKYGRALEGQDLILCVGRMDRGKGSPQLFKYFARFREEVHDRPTKLVLIGSRGTVEVPEHPDIVYLGFVSDREKWDAIAASKVVIIPSLFESLSMVALEAWCLGKPVLVNGVCTVLRSQCVRSDGGLWYESYSEFRETLRLFLKEGRLRERLGGSGRVFVEKFHNWDVITAKYERLVDRARRRYAGTEGR